MLGPYQPSRGNLKFRLEDVAAEYRGGTPRPVTEGDAPAQKAAAGDGPDEGSNNWVVAGDRTFSRAPIMANDPHSGAIQLPCQRFRGRV